MMKRLFGIKSTLALKATSSNPVLAVRGGAQAAYEEFQLCFSGRIGRDSEVEEAA
jgi:hypothetical protein